MQNVINVQSFVTSVNSAIAGINASNPITQPATRAGSIMGASSTLMEAHNQWASRPADQRFQTLDALYEAVSNRRNRSRSVDVDVNRIKVEVDSAERLAVNSVIAPSEPSHWSFGQFCTMLGVPSAFLRDGLSKPLVRDILNERLALQPRDAVKFMTVESEGDGDDLNTLQACTSPTYGRIWDADVVQAVQAFVAASGGKFYNPKAYAAGKYSGDSAPAGLYASDRDVFMFLIDGGSRLDVGPRAQLNRGFMVKNSEVGNSTLELTGFYFNECCGNHFIYGAQGIKQLRIRHTSGAPSRFIAECLPALNDFTNRSATDDQAMIRRAIEYRLPSDKDALKALLNPFAFTGAQVRSAFDFAKSEEGQCETLWDLIQGFTAYARGFDFIDAKTDLETKAGKLLDLVSRN